ncbi:MAG: phosphoribulokinase [Clostridia bacterium]|nr:phosphoribulokinase [Clostridia bacterium]
MNIAFQELDSLIRSVERLAKTNGRVIVAIDGRCASGKTTLASAIAEKTGAAVFHMDDFFLRPEQRTEARLSEPGGNVDRERFLCEVLSPLAEGKNAIVFRPFDCGTMSLSSPATVYAGKIAIVEGSYCLHPDLCGYYGLRVFLTVSREEQMRRLILRDPSKAAAFSERWIPMEERYFEAFGVASLCDLCISTG